MRPDLDDDGRPGARRVPGREGGVELGEGHQPEEGPAVDARRARGVELGPVVIGDPEPVLAELGAEAGGTLGEVAGLGEVALGEGQAEGAGPLERLAEEPELAQVGLAEREREVHAEDQPPLGPAKLVGQPGGEPLADVAAPRRVGEGAPELHEAGLLGPALDLGGDDEVARPLGPAPAEADGRAAVRERELRRPGAAVDGAGRAGGLLLHRHAFHSSSPELGPTKAASWPALGAGVAAGRGGARLGTADFDADPVVSPGGPLPNEGTRD